MTRLSCILLVDGRGRLLLQERDEHPVIDPDRHASDSHDVIAAPATALDDGGVVLGERRRIVLVDASAATGLDLGASAAQIVPAFLGCELYRTPSAMSCP